MVKKAVLDLLTWLKDDLGFTEAEAKELAPKFEPRREKIEGGYLRQADYSRIMGDVKKLQDQIASKDAQLNAEMAEWAALQNQDETKAAQLRTELDTTKVEKFQLEQKLKAFAEEHGVDPATVLPAKTPATGDPNPNPNPAPKPAPFDETKFINREQFGSVTDYLLSVPAELAAIAQEHFDLTGERLDTRPLITELKSRVAAKKPADLRAIWEEKADIPAKRQAKATADHDREIQEAEARGREAARSEQMLPGAHAAGTHAPVFQGQGESKLQRPQPGTAARGFAESLRSRKYAGGAPPATGQK